MLKRPSRMVGLAATAIAAIGLAGGLYLISKAPCFQLVGDFVCQVDSTEKLVALTFDDGPTQRGVDAVLPVLEAKGVRATFFLVGEAMAREPSLARRLADAGHELGNHSYSHRRMLLMLPSTYDDEIARTDALLREAGQADPRLFRPPYGKRLLGLPLAVSRAGYMTVTWDVAEAPLSDAEEYAASIVERVTPGSIVLMHPMFGQADLMQSALPLIVDGLHARGYSLVTVSELLEAAR